MTNKTLKHTYLADFIIDEQNVLHCNLNVDFTEFDVDIETYLHGDNEYTEQEYELIYSEVAKKCNEVGGYTIDCYNNRYTVRKIDDVEKVRYAAMSKSEKAQYNKQKEKEGLEEELADLEVKFKKLDYIGVKIATKRATVEEYAEQIELMNQYAKRIEEIRNKLETLN